tara:strand:- start:433 stop:756 length:324 start_codon:yes stop_codon:yes gene_type:complete
MLSRFLKKNKPIRLGRWAVTNDIKIQEQRTNWANHDNCGSELCEKKFIKEQNKEVKKPCYVEFLKNKKKRNKEVESWTKRLEEKKRKKEKLNSTKMETFDEMLPFCI